MMAFKRSTPILISCAGLVVGAVAPALAGSSQSALDPYAYVQPKGKVAKQKAETAPRTIPNVEDEPSTTTFMSMPTEAAAPASHAKKGGVPGTGLLSKAGGMFGGGKEPKQKRERSKEAPVESIAEKPAREKSEAREEHKKEEHKKVANKGADKGGGITESVTSSTKKVTEGIASGGKSISDGVVSGTKKMGSGIASGAKASGSVFMKGAHVLGEGFKSTGEKMKDGSQAVGSKVAGVPKAIGHGFKSTGDKMKDSSGVIADKLPFKKSESVAAKPPTPKVIPSPMVETSADLSSRPDAAALQASSGTVVGNSNPNQSAAAAAAAAKNAVTAQAAPQAKVKGKGESGKSLMGKLPKLPSLNIWGKGKNKADADGQLTAGKKPEPIE